MWQIILGVGLVFLIMEIMIPSMFFLNFAFAALICAVISYFYQNIIVLTILFCILSFLFIFFLRPLFIKKSDKDEEKTGIEEKYIGKTACAAEPINKNGGVITIYGERWQAKNIEDFTIEAGQNVEIVKNESLIMFVKKVD